MPTFYDGGGQTRAEQSNIAELARRAAMFPISHGRDPFYVFNPKPNEWKLAWKSDKRIREYCKQWNGRAVTAEEGERIFDLPAEDIDKGKNACRRYECTLVIIPVMAYYAKQAHAMLKSLDAVEAGIQRFNSAAGTEEVLEMGKKKKRKVPDNQYDYANGRTTETRKEHDFSQTEIAAVMAQRRAQVAADAIERKRYEDKHGETPKVVETSLFTGAHRYEGDELIIGTNTDEVDMSVFEEKDTETSYSIPATIGAVSTESKAAK